MNTIRVKGFKPVSKQPLHLLAWRRQHDQVIRHEEAV